jgi:hypothetical protein
MGRSRSTTIAPSILDVGSLDPAGVVVSFAIDSAADALDAIELSRPETFQSGVIALLLDANRVPIVALAVDGAPSDDLDPLADLLCAACQNAPQVWGVVLGIVRGAASDSLGPLRSSTARRLWLDTSEVVSWLDLGERLGRVDVELTEVVVLEPEGWFALSESRVPD